jgi:hypothetical protein
MVLQADQDAADKLVAEYEAYIQQTQGGGVVAVAIAGVEEAAAVEGVAVRTTQQMNRLCPNLLLNLRLGEPHRQSLARVWPLPISDSIGK